MSTRLTAATRAPRASRSPRPRGRCVEADAAERLPGAEVDHRAGARAFSRRPVEASERGVDEDGERGLEGPRRRRRRSGARRARAGPAAARVSRARRSRTPPARGGRCAQLASGHRRRAPEPQRGPGGRRSPSRPRRTPVRGRPGRGSGGFGRGAVAPPGPTCPGAVHRQGVDALTSRAAFPLAALRFRNRLLPTVPLLPRCGSGPPTQQCNDASAIQRAVAAWSTQTFATSP